MYRLAERVKVIGESKITESLKVLEQDPTIISLGAGEPDFPAPKIIIKATEKALTNGYTHYSPIQGKKLLREAIVEKLKKENKIDVTPEQVMTSCGSKEAIMISVMTLADPGEEVFVPDPGYIAYKPIVECFGARPISMPLLEQNNFEPNLDDIKSFVTANTKAIIINSPANPTGAVFKKKTLENIADFAVDNDLMIISDEAYEKLVYDDAKHISIGSLDGMENNVLTLQSFSKTYAMCGFRVGYAVGPAKVIKEMTEFKICTTLGAPTANQMAAVEALKKAGPYAKKMCNEYNRRRKLIIKRLNSMPGIRCTKPRGAFYAFPNVEGVEKSSEKFSDKLLKSKVMVVPGTEFGKHGEGYVRMSYATAYEKIEEAMNRIEVALK
jgi:aminotransferase